MYMVVKWVDQQRDYKLYLTTKTVTIRQSEVNKISRRKSGHTIFFALFTFVVTKKSRNLHMCSTINRLKINRRTNLETVIFFLFKIKRGESFSNLQFMHMSHLMTFLPSSQLFFLNLNFELTKYFV